MYLTTKALVLREVKFKEADKMLTVLSETDGKLSVRARGALRKGCRFSAATLMPTYSEMTLFGNRGKWSLDEAETLEQFIGLREDLGSLALAAYFTELLEAVSDEDSPNPGILRLGLNCLYALSRNLASPEKIKAAFELRLMRLSGYEPYLEACSVCDETEIENPVFRIDDGMLQCAECAKSWRGRVAPLCRDSLAAARYILSADQKRILSFDIPDDALERLGKMAEEYTLAQTDRGFNSLSYWKSVK